MDPLRVLVVDDEPGMRLGVARALHEWRVHLPDVEEEVAFAVEQAASGEEALECIERRAPDLLLLDHKRPGISGFDVLDRLAGRRLDMLTVMITAYASIEAAVSATRRGAWEFLPKPFTPGELHATIQKTAARLLLARRARALAEANKQVRFEFVRVLGHELKAPLNAVSGNLEILKARSLGDNLADYDGLVVRCLVRIEGMRRMIGDLLDLTRIESGRKVRRLADVDAAAVARAVIEGFAPDAQRRGIVVALEVTGDVTMLADPAELEMLLGNLVSNAIKYNRDNGRVDVSLTRDDDLCVVRVADTGIGMTSEQRERVFEEFVRVRGAATAGVEGTGLGLSILRKLVQLYRGQVRVESEPGIGTVFTVAMPLRAPADEQAPAALQAPGSASEVA
jgi:signal transduction histidine kinase